jgi:hypothetical protein
MSNSDLEKRSAALRKEIANLRQTMCTIDPSDRGEQLERVWTICALRERELKDVDAQLAKRT